jgi:NDP-sugar pyrophosphorylase family protein
MTAQYTSDHNTQQQPHNHLEIKPGESSSSFVAIVLASSVGSRLFPLTSSRHNSNSEPKHLLSVGGIPILHRLLDAIANALNFSECIVVVAADDCVTVPSLQRHFQTETTVMATMTTTPDLTTTTTTDLTTTTPSCIVVKAHTNLRSSCQVTVQHLPPTCMGSAHAVRLVMASELEIRCGCMATAVVFPGDLLIFNHVPLEAAIHQHRSQKDPSTACTILLTCMGEQDEHGVPLTESAKQKKGGLAREDAEIEYMALSFSKQGTMTAPRVVWKQAKLDVEEDKDMGGATPKLVLPKSRLQHNVTKVRTDWNDLHVYILAPWVRQLIQARESILFLKEDLLPLLIARQFKGVAATFKSRPTALPQSPLPPTVLLEDESMSSRHDTTGVAAATTTTSLHHDNDGAASDEYLVDAYIICDDASCLVRAHTVSAYLYANRELVRRSLEEGDTTTKTKMSYLSLPPNTLLLTKFQSIVMDQAVGGDDIQQYQHMKGTVIGRNCIIGRNCRLNNVVLLDDCSIADQCMLQNTIVGANARIQENCSLNECQVGPRVTVVTGTKEKGESFVVEDDE